MRGWSITQWMAWVVGVVIVAIAALGMIVAVWNSWFRGPPPSP